MIKKYLVKISLEDTFNKNIICLDALVKSATFHAVKYITQFFEKYDKIEGVLYTFRTLIKIVHIFL